MIYSGVQLNQNQCCMRARWFSGGFGSSNPPDFLSFLDKIYPWGNPKAINHHGVRLGEIWGHLLKNGRLILRSSMNDVRADFEPHVQYEEEFILVEILEGIHVVGVLKWPYFVKCFHYRLQLQRKVFGPCGVCSSINK